MSNSISSSRHQVSILGATDYWSLVRLANAASAKDRHASADLVDKLEKSVVVPDGHSPEDTVGIGRSRRSARRADCGARCRKTNHWLLALALLYVSTSP